MQTVGSMMTITYMRDNQEEKEKMTEEEKNKRIKEIEREIEVLEKEIQLAKKKKELEEIQGFRVRDTFPITPLQPYYDKGDDKKFDWYRITCKYE